MPPSTLRHYFGGRDGVFSAIVAHQHALAAPHLAAAATPAADGLKPALSQALLGLRLAWRHFGVDAVHATALAEGLLAPSRGPAYLDHTLEPTLQAYEALLSALVARGDLPGDLPVRAAALALVGPVLLALLHQSRLGGERCRPLDEPAFIEAHLDAWIAGWAR